MMLKRAVALSSIWLVSAFSFFGCIQAQNEAGPAPSCQINPDQQKSFMVAVQKFPQSVTADSAFTDSQKQAIAYGITTWNQDGNEHVGHSFFQSYQGDVPDSVKSGDPRQCGASLGTDSSFFVVRVDSMTRWQALGFSQNIPAGTIRCSEGSAFEQQVIFVNPSLVDPSQMKSIIVHELGHALGLDHSCADNPGNPEFVGCAGLSQNNPYHQAVMFPSLRVGNAAIAPEIKETLQSNDILRTQCLYGPHQ